MGDSKAPSLDVKKSSKKEEEKPRRTIRIELKLFEPSSDSFPRFNVPKLLYKEMKKYKKSKEAPGPVIDESASMSQSHSQLSDHEDDDVARIARQFEEKYGAGSGYDAVADKGAGYDENDSFIDNTEAFDEMFVDDTPRGGFYINSGRLEFNKKESTSKEVVKDKIVASKKRSIGSLSSAETDNNEENGGTSSGTNSKKLKTHKAKTKKVKRKENDEPEKKGKVIAIKDMLRAKRDNLLKSKSTSPVKHHRNKILSDDEESEPGSIALSESSTDSDVKVVEAPPIIVELPPDLPESIMSLIKEFKTTAFGKTHDDVTNNESLYQILQQIDSSYLSQEKKNQIQTYMNSIAQSKGLYKRLNTERKSSQTISQSTSSTITANTDVTQQESRSPQQHRSPQSQIQPSQQLPPKTVSIMDSLPTLE